MRCFNTSPLIRLSWVANRASRVEFILELYSSGATLDDILKAYTQLTEEAVTEALRYAARFLKNEVVLTSELSA